MTRSALVADAGGTNIRFALVDADSGVPVLRAPKAYRWADVGDIETAARTYLGEADAKPVAAAFAVAGPATDGAIRLTNLGLTFRADAIGRMLGIADVSLLNDFEAIALSVPHLAPADRVVIGPGAPGETGGTVAIAGPGTGFGVAGLVHGRALVCEGGHVDFAPRDEVEIEILRFLRRRFGRVSVERILSGPGLVNLYEALAAIDGIAGAAPSPQEITAEARADAHSLSAAVFARFCRVLGAVAGDIALTMGARGGVMLAGGVLPAMRDMLAAGPFRACFEAKGRFQAYMKAIPTALIVQDFAGLIGAASFLAMRKRAPGDDADLKAR